MRKIALPKVARFEIAAENRSDENCLAKKCATENRKYERNSIFFSQFNNVIFGQKIITEN